MMNTAAEAGARGTHTVDVGSVIDAGAWTGYQKLVLVLAAASIVLDGFDTQAIGFAAPSLIGELGITKAALAPVLASGLIGMTIGAAVGGAVGDRFGRKAALIGSVIVFGVLTGLMATANTVTALAALRFLAGLGLGGAIPNASALVAEFTPARRRSIAVSASIVCIPVGGIVGGLIATAVLPTIGWRGLFVIAGTLPVILAILLMLALPESVRFLARRREGWPQIARTLGKMGVAVDANTQFVDRTEEPAPDKPFRSLFAPGFRADTIALWSAFFFCLLAVYMAFNWLPAMLTDQGFSLPAASSGLLAFNIGGAIAAIAGAWLASTYGSRKPMVIMALAASAGAAALIIWHLDASTPLPILLAALAFEGACIAGLQVILYALAAHMYPTGFRATGVGAAAGIGRLGAVLSTVIGAAVLAQAGSSGFYGVIAFAMLVAALAISLVRRHVPARAR